MKHKHIITATLFFVLALGGCAEQSKTPAPKPEAPTNPEVPTDPDAPTDPDVPTRSLQYYILDGSDAPLFYQAIRSSGVYDDLSTDRYPILLMVAIQKGVLEAYIAEQGLSEAEFLAHPKLPEFIKSHLVYDEVDVVELRSTPGARAIFESAAGTEVVIENKPYPEMDLANGVVVDLGCSESGDPTYPNPGSTDEKALLCQVAEPIVKDFDWSQ